MSSNVFLVSAIKEITKEKLAFWNYENQLQEIVFLSAEKIVLEENYCIGERDWFARNPYCQFYTPPKNSF